MNGEKFIQPSLKLLLVEDDPEFASILKIRLTREKNPPLQITCALDLQQALDLLQENSWDLILLDLVLPDSSGIQTFIKVHAQARHTPIVIMTGLDNDALAIDAVRKGADDYVVKNDFNSKLLLRIIHHAIDRHRIKEKLASVTGRLRETNLRLEKMAALDPLTELYNRSGLQQALNREIQLMIREGWDMMALVIDIDNFKKINDSLGHPVGDILLKETSKQIRDAVRLSDHIARVGGDEFILILPKTELNEGLQLAERLKSAISHTTISLGEKETFRVTASIGVTPVPEQITSVDELLAIADPLLRRSKANGKNCISYNELERPKERVPTTSPSPLPEILRKGNDFFALKQPIVRLEDQAVIGYEFLSRLQNGAVCMPDVFFRVAMENNILTLVDRHCFRSCVTASSELPAQMHRHINLFPATIIDLQVEELIEKLSVNCPAQNYCLEISEQQILGEPSHLIGPVETFKNYGIQIAVDDVGFGNTCLESLILLEPDVVKLDKKYVIGISKNPQVERSMRRVLKIAEDLNSEVIAEGIESEEDLQRLKEIGVKYGQGFFLGRPA
ncbi:MAG TPA: diguanylate cyclase [Candidatus Omnitrophota bacterium]|nr:diguanylate cyclase [Candidatus Omnitrophota bacterium]